MSQWGWTPPATSPTAPAPDVLSVRVGTGLQAAHDALTGGGIIQLGAGTYYADPSSPTTPLTITNPCISIEGAGRDTTIIGSPIFGQTADGRLQDLIVRPPGGAYGVKLFRDEATYPGGGGVPRWTLNRVFIGAVDAASRNAGLGPAVGLWVDGAILLEAMQCVFGFNSSHGLFMTTTSPGGVWSTNINRFHGCSVNLNGGYGINLQGGSIMLPSFHGGNMEHNVLGDVLAVSCTNLILDGVDFETSVGVTNVLDIQNCSQASVRRCNFVSTGAAVRAFVMQGCNRASVEDNLFNGYTALDYGVFADNCVACEERRNVHSSGAAHYIHNRGSRAA